MPSMPRYGLRLLAVAGGLLLPFIVLGSAAAAVLHYTVEPGDTLSGIASVYGVTVGAISELNAIADPDRIFPGDILGIPLPGQGSRQAAGTAYKVQPGDTLSGIGARFGVPVQALQKANGLKSDLIIAGEELMIPTAQVEHSFSLPATAPSSPWIEGIIDEICAAEGVDAGLVRAVAWVESGWNQGAVSPAGALGLMQIMPGTWSWLESDVFGYRLNVATSAYDNIKAGARLLRILLNGAGGDVDSAVGSYYQGQGATANGILYSDTVGYVWAVQAMKARFWP